MERRNTCPKCRALLERGTRFCPYCGTDTRHLDAPSARADADATSHFGVWILCLNLAVFAATVVLDPLRSEQPLMKPSGESWIIFGSCHSFFVEHCGHWWRYLTAVFLHGDLLHLLMNSFAILMVLPIAAHAFGAPRTVVIYLLAGVGGFLVSTMVRPVNAAGASGALCGLIGALLAWGHRRRGLVGEAVKRQMMTWTAYLLILGFLFQNRIDNWGHAGGFGTGLLLGWLAARVSMRGGREDRLWRGLAVGVVAAAVLVVAVFAAPATWRGLQRREVEIHRADLRAALDAVRDLAAGDRPAAALPEFPELPELPEDGAADSAAVRESIRSAAQVAGRAPGSAEAVAALASAEERYDEWRVRACCRYSMLELLRD